MDKLIVTEGPVVTADDALTRRLGGRFARMDGACQLAVLAVEALKDQFEKWPRERIGICLGAAAGSLSTDAEFWQGRNAVGGPSPTLFTYTLPSAALGEIAIRHQLTGPNLCFVGAAASLVREATAMIHNGEADACVCVSVESLSAAGAELIGSTPTGSAQATFVQRQNFQ